MRSADMLPAVARRKLSKQEMDFRLKRLELLAPWYGRAMVTIAVAVPVGIATWLLQPFAGKTTSLTISAVVGLSVAANGLMATSVWRKSRAMRDQSAELNRLRGRLEAYETGTVARRPARERG